MIESVQNPQIKRLRKLLTSASFRKKESAFVIESLKVADAFFRQFPDHVQTLYVVDSIDVPDLFSSLPIEYVHASVMAELSSLETASGFCCLCSMPPDPVLTSTHQEGRYLFLDGVRDPANFGAIVRSATAFGIDAILASSDSVDVFHPKTLRSMAGLGFTVPILKNADAVLDQSEWASMTWVLLDVSGGCSLSELSVQGPTVFVLGSEGQGLSSRFKRLKTVVTCTIPLAPGVESLNVAVTAGIVCYALSGW